MDFNSNDASVEMHFAAYDKHGPTSAARRALEHECARTGLYGDGVYDIILKASVGANTFRHTSF